MSAKMAVLRLRPMVLTPFPRSVDPAGNATLPGRQSETPASVTASHLDIYMLAIGGTGMAPLACLLQDQGHRVQGVDGPLYPPMSTLLEGAGIRPWVGFDPAHLTPAP